MERIAEAAGALTQALAGFDPARLSGSQALELVETLAGVERVCAATRARAAARAEDCGAWRVRGHRSGAEWLATTMGTSRGQAAAAIETAKAVEGLGATREAFAAGRISEGGRWPGRRRSTPPPKTGCCRPPSVAISRP